MAAPTLVRREPEAPATDVAPGRARSVHREASLLAATIALLVAAVLPLTRVFIGLAFLSPLVGALLLAVGLSAILRRFGTGPAGSLLANVLAWLAFSAMAFLRPTLALGFLPTPATLGAGRELWLRGIELLRVSPAPTFAEAALLFLTATGVWAIAHAVEGLVFRLEAPLKAIGMALILWTVPLALAPRTGRVWLWALPLLASSGLLLLLSAGSDLARWGRWTGRGRPTANAVSRAGLATACAAIAAGALLGGLLPGFGDAPWYEVRGVGGTTLTRNPMVTIRSQLVSQSTVPLLRVRTERPVYLRVTALDAYSANEEWTISEGIRGNPLTGSAVPPDAPVGFPSDVEVEINVAALTDAILVPVPYQPTRVAGPVSDAFQFDPRSATMTLDRGRTLQRGDTYAVTARVTDPPPDVLDRVSATGLSPSLGDAAQHIQLPPSVPQAVHDLARQIVEKAGAVSPYERAFAIQNELRTWTYSLDPPQGHGSQAMLSFIENRIGYCEQYAGTMAVMLRTLGIPARVAVGFTPGRLVDAEASQYVISQVNAHAWVEVLIDELGWVSFEPTPRSDDNVLVPTPADIAPSATVQEADVAQPDVSAPPPDDRDFLPPPVAPETPFPAADAPARPAQETSGLSVGTILLLLLASLAAVGVAAAGVRVRQGPGDLPPAERVLRARAQVATIGRGLGLRPTPWETDREYVGRLSADAAAADLATALEEVRYAGDGAVARATAERAEAAARLLQETMLSGLTRPGRAAVRVRGSLGSATDRLSALMRQRSG